MMLSNFILYGVNLERGILDKIFYAVAVSDIP
jgi:hypothetical protein